MLEDAIHPLYVSSGHLLFVRPGGVMIAPFSAETLSLTGPASPVPFDVMVDDGQLVVVQDWFADVERLTTR